MKKILFEDRYSKPVKMIISALGITLCLILPFFVAQIQTIGKMLSPMHLPTMICGIVCGPFYGLAVGFISPMLRSVVFGLPAMFPTAIAMSFETAVYGFVAGIFFRIFPRKKLFIYPTLLIAMIIGRIIRIFVDILLLGIAGSEIGYKMIFLGATVSTIPGVIVQFILIPPIVWLMLKLIKPIDKKRTIT